MQDFLKIKTKNIYKIKNQNTNLKYFVCLNPKKTRRKYRGLVHYLGQRNHIKNHNVK